jgi:glucose-6-phosphate 1-dehydrogenase
MKNTFIKWGVVFAAGAGALVFTALCFLQKNYTWVMGGLFIGLFLISSSWKRIGFLLKAGKAIKAGQKEIIVYYQDKNLIESQNAIIPAGADTFWFYGFLPEKNDIKAFRWQGIKRVLEDGKELTRDEVLKKLQEPVAK